MEVFMSISMLLPQYDFPRAGRAVGALMRDPDDLPQVFSIIEALSGTSPHRLYLRLRRSETGSAILRRRPEIIPRLANREELRKLPEGSLGRAYLAFVESEGISAEGIRDASDGVQARWSQRPTVFAYIHHRMRDTHDLWHTVTGYKGDVVGELSLLAFILAQNWNTGLAAIVAMALIRGLDRGNVSTILDGYRRGRDAAWLPEQDWESMLALPLEDVRARLKLPAPAVYEPVRTADLRQQGTI
jgi:ubiquinone biosynthesis protein COQ4